MTWNEDLYDATLRRQVDLLRLGTGVSKRVNGILDDTLKDLRQQVERRLGKTTGLDGASLKRMVELERAIVQIRSPAWNDVAGEWTRTALDVVLDEPEWAAGTLGSILPIQVDFVAPSERTLRALATTRPFQGKNLKQWADSAQRSDLTRIQQQIRIGMVQGESARDIAARVFGARGATDITRNQADAVTRTVINHVSNAALNEFRQENADLFSEEMLVATLDSRTTLLCAGLDGNTYPVGKAPKPPLHVRCRDIVVGVLDGEVIGERPFVAATEQQLLREYADEHGLGRVTSRDQLPRGHKSRYETFRRARVRELTGQVPARTTYQEWLRRQPAAFQDDVLGEARGKLFREGGLTLDKFTHRDGDELTLDELRQRYKTEWERAGLHKPPPAPTPVEVSPLARFAKRFETVGDVTPEHHAATLRGLTRMGAGVSDQVPPLERLLLTGRLGTGEVELPLGMGGDYTPRQGRLRLSTNDATRRLFLRASDLSEVPGYTAHYARDTDGVLEMAAAHEYAHHVHLSGVLRSYIQGGTDAADQLIRNAFESPDRQLVSLYASRNRQEFWAESHVAYHYYPRDWLAANAPSVVSLVERVLRLKGLL
jgi:hypothetical protein